MKRKNILDEMQEQKRLKIESNGLWIGYFGLTAAVLVQALIMQGSQFRTIAGELIILLVLAIYLVPCYLKHGIWSTTYKPSFKLNCFASLFAGLVVGILLFIRTYLRYGKLAGSVATAVFFAGFIFAVCIALLTLCAWLYNRRVKKVEDSPEISEEKHQ